jgi:putative DNA primase/helicase
LRQDGTVLDTPGYDARTGLFYEPGTTEFPAIPAAPTRAEAEAALAVLQAPLKDFPFREQHHRNAAIAALFTVLFRHAITGNVPMIGVNAPTAGTGKTLLVDVIALTATGRSAPKMSQPAREEEWNKQLLTCALEGDQIVLIDNCTDTLASGELCRAITAETIKGRILGVMENGEAPQNAVYFATGNSLRFRGDINRRVLPIELESELERPETRTKFTIDCPLLDWTRVHRPALVQAALTIARAYHLATDKPSVRAWGSFEAWRALVCGPLLWLGLADPILGVEELQHEDEEREQLRTLLLAWDAVYSNTPTTLVKAKQDILTFTTDTAPGTDSVYHALNDALQAFDTAGKPTLNLDSVGKNLKKRERRVICGKTLRRGKTRTNKGYEWFVETRKPCTCVGCVGVPDTREKNGRKVTVKNIDARTSAPPTRRESDAPVGSSNINGLSGARGGKNTYTPGDLSATCPHQEPPPTGNGTLPISEVNIDDCPF